MNLPVGRSLNDEEEIHGAFCFTVSVFPPMVIVPLRPDGPGFAPTEYEIVPLLIPQLTDVIVIQLRLLTAFHAHRSSVITPILPAPPLATNDAELDEIANSQSGPASLSCTTVNVWPAIVNVPCLGLAVKLSLTT